MVDRVCACTVGHPNFNFFQHDVCESFYLEVDQIYHLACPASPPRYQYNPIKTIKTSTQVGNLCVSTRTRVDVSVAARVRLRVWFDETDSRAFRSC